MLKQKEISERFNFEERRPPESPFEKPALRFYNFDRVVAMRRNAIDFETLLRITEGFCKEIG